MAQKIEKMREDWARNDAKRDEGLTTPDTVTRYNDIPYGDEPIWNLLDVYSPKNANGKLPVIISIHGGGYFYGTKEVYQYYLCGLAERGFAVINFNYRLTPTWKYPTPLVDTFSVVDFMVENADKYGFDTDNVFFVGDSAGGQLCHQTCTIISNPEYAKLFDFKVNPSFTLRACALNCGLYSFMLKPFGRLSIMKEYLPDDWKKYKTQFDVYGAMTDKFPPTFLMGAFNDGLKMFVKPLDRKLNQLGIPHIAKIYGSKEEKEIGHVFHVNCKLALAKTCNDDECAFFKQHIV